MCAILVSASCRRYERLPQSFDFFSLGRVCAVSVIGKLYLVMIVKKVVSLA